MKKAGTIIAAIFLSLSALAGLYLGNVNRSDASDIQEYVDMGKKMSGGKASGKVAEMESIASKLKWGSLLTMLGGALAIGLLVSVFVKKPLILGFAAALALFALLAIIITPSFEMGAAEGAAPRTKAMFFAIPALIGAVGAFLHFKGWKDEGALS